MGPKKFTFKHLEFFNGVEITVYQYGLLAEMPDGRILRRNGNLEEFKLDIECYIKSLQDTTHLNSTQS
jgi:hypothetical protein